MGEEPAKEATEGARSRAGSTLGSHAMHDFLRDDARGARVDGERKKDISGMAARGKHEGSGNL